MRDGHLKGADFLDVEKYPTIVFTLKSVKEDGNDKFKAIGDLTIKDVTKEITLDYEHSGLATDPYGNVKVGGTLDRNHQPHRLGPRLERPARRWRPAGRREGQARDRR